MPQNKPSSKTLARPVPDARRSASHVLEKIIAKGAALDEAFESEKGIPLLAPRDRAFCRLLVMGTLRFMGFLDTRLKIYAPRLPTTPLPALLALRLGALQLLILKTQPHAALNASVDLLPPANKALRGVVNAVLRKIATQEKTVTPEEIDPSLCVPAWLSHAWEKDYGKECSAAIARAVLQEAPLDITVKDSTALWQDRLGAVLLPTGSLRLKSHTGDITLLPGFAEGAWWVQDTAASLPVRLAGDVRGKRAYDLCAAPGGKTLQLASAGAHVTAVDHSGTRLQRLRENLTRTKLKADIIEKDVLAFNPAQKADVIILDAPCSATGTLRRHPDLMHRKDVHVIGRLAALQAQMLDHAATLLVPGGLLIYAVCSLQKEEGEGVIEAFLSRHQGFSREPVRADELGPVKDIVTKAGDMRTLPHYLGTEGGMDGFYAARLRRNA